MSINMKNRFKRAEGFDKSFKKWFLYCPLYVLIELKCNPYLLFDE